MASFRGVGLLSGLIGALRWAKKKEEEEKRAIRAFNDRVFHLRSGTLTLESVDEREHFGIRMEFDPAMFTSPRNARSLAASASAALGTPCVATTSVAVYPSGGHDVVRPGRPSPGTMQIDGATFAFEVSWIEIAGDVDEAGLVLVRGELLVRTDRPPLDDPGPWLLEDGPTAVSIALKMTCADEATSARFVP